MKWVRKIIETKRPDFIHDLGMAWSLWSTRWFGVALVLRTRSDSSFDQAAESNRIRVVLEGEYLEHYEVPRLGKYEPAVPVPKDAYSYGNDDGLWFCRERTVGDISFERVRRRGGVELLDARTAGDAIVDFPQWMTQREVIFDAHRPVLMLVISWGGVWR